MIVKSLFSLYNFPILLFPTRRAQKIQDRRRNAMFRLWAKIFKDNRLIRDTVVCDDTDDTRTHKVFNALDKACYELDLGKPIWLDATVAEFKRHSKTRFRADNFIEDIDFDYLEIQIIEE